jgi:RNA polymerase sigma-70 factor, ECF subfamily
MDTQYDDELVRRARTGDREAGDQLVQGHRKRIYAICYAMCGPEEADDRTQEALVHIYSQLPKYAGGCFRAWSHRVTKNLCLDHLRRTGRDRQFIEDDEEEYEDAAPAPDPADRIIESIILEERIEEIAEHLDELRPKYRAALMLWTDEVGGDAAAEALGITRRDFHNRANYARRRLGTLILRDSTDIAESEVERVKPEPTDIPCPQCGRNLLVRTGRCRKFLGCSGFPECWHIMELPEEGAESDPNRAAPEAEDGEPKGGEKQ